MTTHLTAPAVADEKSWFKSSYSDDSAAACVEMAAFTRTPGAVGVRDSKDKAGPALLVPNAAWSSFITSVRSGDLA